MHVSRQRSPPRHAGCRIRSLTSTTRAEAIETAVVHQRGIPGEVEQSQGWSVRQLDEVGQAIGEAFG
jgi:hypothetical protein